MRVESRTPNDFAFCRALLGSSALALMIWMGSTAIARTQAPTSAPSPAATLVPDRFATLRVGSRGAAVVELQGMLKLLGYYSGAIDGQFQESTAVAVAAFQRAAGLQPDGVVGLNTWTRLLPAAPPVASAIASAPSVPTSTATPTPSPSVTPSAAPASAPSPASTPAPAPPVDFPVLRLGMRGPAVIRLQERLRATGFFTGAIDGVFGVQTETAVQTAQRRFQLQADGVVGPETWAALLR